MTSISKPASSSFSPPATVCSASQLSYGPKPGQGTKLMMSASTGFSSCGTHTSAPVAVATGATAPTWSKCVWVSRIPSRVTPSSSIAARSFGASSPGSTISARSDPSRRKMYEFSATGPTVNMRTSMGRRLSPCGLISPLAAAVERQVRVVAQRHVDDQRKDAHHHALGDVLLHDRDEDHEDDRGERRAVQRAAPGRLPAESLLAALLREPAALDLRAALGALRALLGRLAGAAGALDRAGLGAAMPTLSLAPRLCHGPRMSLTRSRADPAGDRSPAAARHRGSRRTRPPAPGQRARTPRPALAHARARGLPRAGPRGGRARSWTPACARARA